jgi:hypothetical protein
MSYNLSLEALRPGLDSETNSMKRPFSKASPEQPKILLPPCCRPRGGIAKSRGYEGRECKSMTGMEFSAVAQSSSLYSPCAVGYAQ